jgi:hypothetical protein
MDEVAELYKLFREAKFNHNPGIEAYEKLGETWLGNVQWVSGLYTHAHRQIFTIFIDHLRVLFLGSATSFMVSLHQ